MSEQRTSATILALADLADISANQLESGHSVEEVIALLRRAALAVRETVPIANDDDPFADEFLEDAGFDFEDDKAGNAEADSDEPAAEDQGEDSGDAVDGDDGAEIVSLTNDLTPMNLDELAAADGDDPKPISA